MALELGSAGDVQTVQTTDAITTLLLTYTRSEANWYGAFCLTVVGRSSTGVTKVLVGLFAVNRVSPGALALVQSPAITLNVRDPVAATWNIAISTTTDSIEVRVTGAAATTINWTGVLTDSFQEF